MNFIRLLPVILSFLLLAAHFYRAGQTVLAVIPILLFIPLAFRQSWVPWLMQAVLWLGALEWVRTLYSVAQWRIEYDQPWHRMAVILGVVAALTALSSLVFRSPGLRRWYSKEQ